MNKFHGQDSLFLLKQTQKNAYEQLHLFDFYFHLIRHEFLDASYVQYCVADLWIYYFYEETPLINSENTLIFLLRNFIIDNTLKNKYFERIKKATVGSNIHALVAAAATINIYLDDLRAILANLSHEDYELYEKYSNNKRILFDARFSQYEHYPRRIVQLDTLIMQELRECTSTRNISFKQKTIEVKKLIDKMIIIEREFFQMNPK